jgi:hypothetical protein
MLRAVVSQGNFLLRRTIPPRAAHFTFASRRAFPFNCLALAAFHSVKT